MLTCLAVTASLQTIRNLVKKNPSGTQGSHHQTLKFSNVTGKFKFIFALLCVYLFIILGILQKLLQKVEALFCKLVKMVTLCLSLLMENKFLLVEMH